MANHISIQKSIPASADRPDFAEWFAGMKQINKLNPVYQRRLNTLYTLRSMGVNAKLLTVTNKYCAMVIVGVAVCGEVKSSITLNNQSSL